MGLISWKLFVDFCRVLSVCSFLICTLSFNWYSFACLLFLLGSLYLLDRDAYELKVDVEFENPYRRKQRVKNENLLSPEIRTKYVSNILDFVLYDVENCQTLLNFDLIRSNTHCTFAKTSKLWGACDYDPLLSLETNIERSIPALIKLLVIGDSVHLDGFIFELPAEVCSTIETFGESVRKVLKYLSDRDPDEYRCMDLPTIAGLGWCFEFSGVPIFVTTFSPCYPTNHSRFSFGSKTGFILLQPMYSFAIHDIGKDTPITNWDNPTTVRDVIRVAFKKHGRSYHIRDTIRYPMSHDIVKPIVEGPGNLFEWWRGVDTHSTVQTEAVHELQEKDSVIIKRTTNNVV